MSDPYQDPKKVFDELRQRKNIQSYKISEKTDFKQAKEIGKMDIEILNFEMKLKETVAWRPRRRRTEGKKMKRK